jgi:type I restriction enzyme S subunit
MNKGTPGQICLVPYPVYFCIAQGMIAIRPDAENSMVDIFSLT